MGWLGVGFIAASWLFGLGYYHAADLRTSSILVSLAVVAFLWLPTPSLPSRRSCFHALWLFIPVVIIAPWPYQLAGWLLMLGCALQVASPLGSRRPRWRRFLNSATNALFVAGLLHVLQGLAVNTYAAVTARNHDLPSPLPAVIGTVARLLDVDSAVYDKTVALHSMRRIHPLGATWELFCDPVTCCFLASLAAACGLMIWRGGSEPRRTLIVRSLSVFLVVVLLWLPFRTGVVIALYLHDVLRTDYEANLAAMRLFWDPWLHWLLLAGPIVICWRLRPLRSLGTGWATPEQPAATALPARRLLAACCLISLGVVCTTCAIAWDPIGKRQPGRVMVEEYHSNPEEIWEPTFKPYDTNWYGPKSGYNYACIYEYCSRFYRLSRRTEPLAEDALTNLDVLIIKVPTRRFADEEIDAIDDFVTQGGGLLLIGEHTNVYRTSDYLNPIAARFGFQFRNDCLFGIDKVFEQLYRPPLVPHPIVQRMPAMWFATSCSIAPKYSAGRAAIMGKALKNLEADYHATNYYPQPDNLAEMRYGSFVQLWATRHGEGRVVGFTDSTIFSNFSAFEPGKSELMLGMVEWLNHRSAVANPRPWLFVLGMMVLVGGLIVARYPDRRWLLLVAYGACGWALAVIGIWTANDRGMPEPEPIAPLTQVNIDRTVCDSPLAKNGFVNGSENGFGIFERWILRLGYFTARRIGSAVFDGDVAVFLRPNQPVDDHFIQRMKSFVASGGRLLVVDSKRSGSTSNALLEPFGLTVDGQEEASGPLRSGGLLPEVEVRNAAITTGGEPFAWVAGRPVGTKVSRGKGTVTVIGFGSLFTDLKMGVTADVEPDENLRTVFDVHFALLKMVAEGERP